jgi:hypothetical protein
MEGLSMSTTDTAARLRALEAKIDAQTARITALETINSRLVDATSRLFDLIADRTLWAAEELVSVDERVTEEAEIREAAVRSRAPRGFKFPVVVHETIVENQPKHFWVTQNYYQMKAWMRITRLEHLLERKGVISSQDQSELAVGGGDDSTVWEKRMAEHFPDYDNP